MLKLSILSCAKNVKILYICLSSQRYRIFFSLEKIVVTHSLKFRKICIFFSEHQEKNTAVFFFPRKKITLHSLTRFKPLYFFSGTGKKIVFLLTHSILDELVTKVIFSRNKKNTVPLSHMANGLN